MERSEINVKSLKISDRTKPLQVSSRICSQKCFCPFMIFSFALSGCVVGGGYKVILWFR